MNPAKPIYFTIITNRELLEKVKLNNLNTMEAFLSDRLPLAKYGEAVKRVVMMFIAFDPDLGFHKENLEYSKKEKDLIITHRMDGAELRRSAPEEILPLLASAYLAALEKIATLKLRDFDHLRFKEDVQHLFEKKEWLVAQAA